jgi:PST family polysaccharide transporter
VAARGVNVFVQVGSTILLARMLSPHDYGLVAMVSAIVGFAPMLIDLGMTDAAVQKPSISRNEVSALFWLNLLLGVALAAVLIACSPLIATFYHEPQLVTISIVSSLTFVFSALSCQHYALLRRAMQFQRIAAVDVTSNVLSAAAAIALALAGAGYWALVARPIFTALFSALGVWSSCRWLPGIPRWTSGLKEMLKFGIHVTGFTMTDYIGRSADRVALGYYFGARELGYFQNAYALYDNALGLLTGPLHTVAVSGLSKLRENLDELRRSWATALSALAFFAMPGFAILAVVAPEVVILLLGNKWAAAGALLSIFAVRGMAHIVERTMGWLHVAAARSDRWMRWGLVSSALQVAALFCGLPFGLNGVAIAYAVATYVLVVPAIVYAGRPLGIGALDVVKVVGPQLLGAVCAAALGLWLRLYLPADMSSILKIILLATASAGVYLLIALGLFRLSQPLRVAASLLRGFVPSRLLMGKAG